MSKKSVFCIATSLYQADQIVNRLKTAQFSNLDISVFFTDEGPIHDFAHAPEGVVAGADTAVEGGALKCLADSADGDITSELIAIGLPQPEARRYEGELKAGHILISVRSDHWAKIPQAKQIFAHAGAQDVCARGEAAAKRGRALDL